MSIEKTKIKQILSDILYLDDPETIADETRIFTDLSLNSIDFIDLIFELRNSASDQISAETLWPFPNMLLDVHYYRENKWTEAGLQKIEKYLGKKVSENVTLKDLYPHFTVNYIQQTINEIAI